MRERVGDCVIVYTTIDFETSNYNNGSPFDDANIPVCVCLDVCENLTQEGKEYYRHFLDTSVSNMDVKTLVDILKETTVLIAHNIKFELHWLRRMKTPYMGTVYDTMLGGFIERGSSKTHSLSLSSLTGEKQKLGDLLIHKHQLNPAELPSHMVTLYCMEDVRATKRLAVAQMERLGIHYI